MDRERAQDLRAIQGSRTAYLIDSSYEDGDCEPSSGISTAANPMSPRKTEEEGGVGHQRYSRSASDRFIAIIDGILAWPGGLGMQPSAPLDVCFSSSSAYKDHRRLHMGTGSPTIDVDAACGYCNWYDATVYIHRRFSPGLGDCVGKILIHSFHSPSICSHLPHPHPQTSNLSGSPKHDRNQHIPLLAD